MRRMGIPGIMLSARPPNTSKIGYATFSRFAKSTSKTINKMSPMANGKVWCTAENFSKYQQICQNDF